MVICFYFGLVPQGSNLLSAATPPCCVHLLQVCKAPSTMNPSCSSVGSCLKIPICRRATMLCATAHCVAPRLLQVCKCKGAIDQCFTLGPCFVCTRCVQVCKFKGAISTCALPHAACRCASSRAPPCTTTRPPSLAPAWSLRCGPSSSPTSTSTFRPYNQG